ncbi:chemotaxis protein CheW [bacterium]|nr:chemotaxis protein CheW [bacterium]
MSKSNRYICFNLGAQEYGVPLLSIKEVLALPEVTPIPQSPNHFLGIMNLRGNVISVMDLRIKIGVKSANTDETSVMILDLGSYLLGVVVDKINAVLTLNESDISERPILESTKSTDYIENVYRSKDQLVLLISIAKALSLEDQTHLSNQTIKAA